MTDELMQKLAADGPVAVCVTANDYSYEGWLVSAFAKRSGAWRCVVEDANGRLFVHNSTHLETRVT